MAEHIDPNALLWTLLPELSPEPFGFEASPQGQAKPESLAQINEAKAVPPTALARMRGQAINRFDDRARKNPTLFEIAPIVPASTISTAFMAQGNSARNPASAFHHSAFGRWRHRDQARAAIQEQSNV